MAKVKTEHVMTLKILIHSLLFSYHIITTVIVIVVIIIVIIIIITIIIIIIIITIFLCLPFSFNKVVIQCKDDIYLPNPPSLIGHSLSWYQ